MTTLNELMVDVDLGTDEDHPQLPVVATPKVAVSAATPRHVHAGLRDSALSFVDADTQRVLNVSSEASCSDPAIVNDDLRSSVVAGEQLGTKSEHEYELNIRNDLYDLDQSEIMRQVMKQKNSKSTARRLSQLENSSDVNKPSVRTKWQYDKDIKVQMLERRARKERKRADYKHVLDREEDIVYSDW